MALSESQTQALALVSDFRTHQLSAFSNLSRSDVADGLEVRIKDAKEVSSANSSLCGAAYMTFELAQNDPAAYAKAAIGLYDNGRATIKSLTVTPSKTFRDGKLPSGNAAADWLMLGSLRDSENWLFTYKESGHWWDDLKAIQMPHTVADWMRKFGYTDIKNETNVVFCKDWDNVVEANKLFDMGYKVSLFINAQMLYTSSQEDSSTLPDHWVGMASKATSSAIHADPAAKLSLMVFSWAKIRDVSEDSNKKMHPKVFLRNYYGYVAGKP
jgi:hypothetical protein